MSSLGFKISPKIIIFITAELCFLVSGIKVKIDTFYFFFFLLFILLSIDLILSMINLVAAKKLKISRLIQNKLTAGESLHVELSLHNQGYFPLINSTIGDSLEYANKKTDRTLFLDLISPGNKLNLKYDYTCQQRGKYIISPVTIRHFGLLGFFYIEKIAGLEKEVYVYPQTFRIQKVSALVKGSLPWFGVETNSITGDEHNFFGVREYKRGDSIKRIHWLSTARKNQLIIKEFEKQSFYQASIVFILNKDEDWGKGNEKVSEYILKIAASLAKYFIEKGVSVEILAHTGKINHLPPNKGESYLEEIFKLCALAQAESKINLKEFLQEYSEYIHSNSTVFVLLTDKNMKDIGEILYLKSRNISIVPLILISSTFLSYPGSQKKKEALKKQHSIKLFNAAGVKALFFCKGDDLEEVFLQTPQ
ncbi:MAG: DUF58 domain-containing protein [Candidatus Omnitrophota bacterium]